MKNKKIYLFIGIFIILLAIIIFAFIINNNNIDNNTTSNTSNETNEEEQVLLPTFTIKSTKDNPIEMDDIEATSLELTNNFGDIKIITTLKNNSKEDVKGFFIEIELQDENGKRITTIAENSEETIKAKGEITLTNYISEEANGDKIKNAKILTIEKNSIKDSIENSFDEMEESISVPEVEQTVKAPENE